MTVPYQIRTYVDSAGLRLFLAMRKHLGEYRKAVLVPRLRRSLGGLTMAHVSHDASLPSVAVAH